MEWRGVGRALERQAQVEGATEVQAQAQIETAKAERTGGGEGERGGDGGRPQHERRREGNAVKA
jgi:hypothetical protein